MYGIEPLSWKVLSLVLGILLSLMFVFESIVRKYLKVEKRKSFSYNHVNEKHKKLDLTIKISFMIIFLIIVFYLIMTSSEPIWYLEPGFLVIVFLVISETTRAFMEWKYEENQNAYIYTIIQLVFALILIAIIIFINSLNLF